jgi:hypothetical protein
MPSSTEPLTPDEVTIINRAYAPNSEGWARDMRRLIDTVEALRDRPCPHVSTSDEGTSHCTLAETEVRALRTALREAVDWMDNPDGEPDSGVLVERWRALLDNPAPKFVYGEDSFGSWMQQVGGDTPAPTTKVVTSADTARRAGESLDEYRERLAGAVVGGDTPAPTAEWTVEPVKSPYAYATAEGLFRDGRRVPLAVAVDILNRAGATPDQPVAWTSQDAIDNMARQRAEGLSHYAPQVRVDRPDDYNTVPLYAGRAGATPDLTALLTVIRGYHSGDLAAEHVIAEVDAVAALVRSAQNDTDGGTDAD